MRLRTYCFYLYVAASIAVAGVLIGEVNRLGNRIRPACVRITSLESAVMRTQQQPSFNDLLAVSVRVDVGYGCGTGVLVTRQLGNETRTYVWTAGHVVKGLRQKDGAFKEATIYQERRRGGLYCGKRQVKAKVTAYSDPEQGEDLALLEVQQSNFCPIQVSAKFAARLCALSGWNRVGSRRLHVGHLRLGKPGDHLSNRPEHPGDWPHVRPDLGNGLSGQQRRGRVSGVKRRVHWTSYSGCRSRLELHCSGKADAPVGEEDGDRVGNESQVPNAYPCGARSDAAVGWKPSRETCRSIRWRMLWAVSSVASTSFSRSEDETHR